MCLASCQRIFPIKLKRLGREEPEGSLLICCRRPTTEPPPLPPLEIRDTARLLQWNTLSKGQGHFPIVWGRLQLGQRFVEYLFLTFCFSFCIVHFHTCTVCTNQGKRKRSCCWGSMNTVHDPFPTLNLQYAAGSL